MEQHQHDFPLSTGLSATSQKYSGFPMATARKPLKRQRAVALGNDGIGTHRRQVELVNGVCRRHEIQSIDDTNNAVIPDGLGNPVVHGWQSSVYRRHKPHGHTPPLGYRRNNHPPAPRASGGEE